jgi:ABC-type glycerol-3-phosphate transport system substrate-binding protein
VVLVFGQALAGGNGYFLDLQPFLDTESQFSSDDFWTDAFQGCQGEGGKLVGVPLSFGLSGIFVSQDAFSVEEASLLKPGWTWSDFFRVYQSLEQTYPHRTIFMDETNLSDSILAPIVSAQLQSKEKSFDAQALAQQLNWYVADAQAKTLFPLKTKSESARELADREDLFSEAPPLLWVGSLNTTLPGGHSPAIESVRFLPFPVDEKNPDQGATPLRTLCIAMSAGSRNHQAAWEWIKYLSEHWGQTVALNPRTEFPARRAVGDQSAIWGAFPLTAQESLRYIVEHGWFGSDAPQLFSGIEKGLQEALLGSVPLEMALEKVAVSSADTSPIQATSVIAVATVAPDQVDDQSEIRFYGLGNKYVHDLENLAADFEKQNSDIHILIRDIEGISPEPGHDPMTLAEQQMDCFLIDSVTDGEGVLPLNPYIDQEPAGFREDFFGGLDGSRSGGNLYNLPAFSRPLVMYYNPELLEQHGFHPPAETWTFNEFIQMVTAVSVKDTADPTYGFLYEPGWSDPFLLAGRGVSSYDAMTLIPSVTLDTAEMRSSLAWLTDLKNSGVFMILDANTFRQAEDAVLAGKVAFWINPMGAPFSGPNIGSFQPGMAALPTTLAPNPLLGRGSDYGYSIASQSQSPAACWRWIKYLSANWATADLVPSRQSLASSVEWENLIGVQTAQSARRAMQESAQASLSVYNPVIGPLVTWQAQAVELSLAGNPPANVLKRLQSQADDYLRCVQGLGLTEANRLSLRSEIGACVPSSSE